MSAKTTIERMREAAKLAWDESLSGAATTIELTPDGFVVTARGDQGRRRVRSIFINFCHAEPGDRFKNVLADAVKTCADHARDLVDTFEIAPGVFTQDPGRVAEALADINLREPGAIEAVNRVTTPTKRQRVKCGYEFHCTGV